MIHLLRRRRAMLVLAVMWLLGLSSLGAVLVLQHRVDQRRQAQVAVTVLQKQVSELSPMAFGGTGGLTREQVDAQLTAAEGHIATTAATLTALSGTPADSVLLMTRARPFFAVLAGVNMLASSGRLEEAGYVITKASKPGGPALGLARALSQVELEYDREAASARRFAGIGSAFAIVLLLLAFSLALLRVTVLAREKQRLLEMSREDALTDQLTGLANRRKLFSDMNELLAEHRPGEILALGMFDLDGFKAYNDTFGHPAGDALLARLGQRLIATVDGDGTAYRLGGDEFCVIARGLGAEALLDRAQEALSEHGEGFSVGCGLGSIVIAQDDVTIEEALLLADQRLYNNKRSSRTGEGGQARDVLLRVLAESSSTLAAHMSTVGRLALGVAEKLGLSTDEIMLTRLTAELHDIGKTAIPDTILDKPGPLDDQEWAFMKRHTIIGERILAAAPALARIAPLVRATHERPDGMGYPDGLHQDEIPLSSRIVAVVDAYDAMTSKRSYSMARSPEQAVAELSRCAGTQFDAAVVVAFIEVLDTLDVPRPDRGLDARVRVRIAA